VVMSDGVAPQKVQKVQWEGWLTCFSTWLLGSLFPVTTCREDPKTPRDPKTLINMCSCSKSQKAKKPKSLLRFKVGSARCTVPAIHGCQAANWNDSLLDRKAVSTNQERMDYKVLRITMSVVGNKAVVCEF
jgi:hypothetical protein